MRPFQIFLLAGFAFLAVVALVFLSIYQTHKKQTAQEFGSSVVIWGTLPSDIFKNELQSLQQKDKAFDVVSYKQIDATTFQSDLVNAIADGDSPDMIILKSDTLVNLRTKLTPISYATISQRQFKDSYIDGAAQYALADGIYGIPFAVDPMVLYWNRDIFSSNDIALPPTTWESIVSNIVPTITKRDSDHNIMTSGIAFGEYSNVTHPKDILMTLLLQSGSKMVTESNSTYKVALDESLVDGAMPPFQSALQFYTEFSDPNSPLYSWNRAESEDKTAFLSGDLALYFGLGSEYNDIANKNPNLNFDMTMVPQGANATILRTYADMYAYAFPRASKNIRGAYAVAQVLNEPQNELAIAKSLSMAPAERSLIAQGDTDPYRKIILQSALIARSWLDPDPQKSDAVFSQMVEDVVSNRARVNDAVSDAINRLTALYQ